MVTVGGQGNGCGLPGLHQGPYHLIGVFTGGKSFAACGNFQLDVLVHTRGGRVIVIAVDIEGDDGACLQGLAEVHTEVGPAMIPVAHLQGVIAAVFGGSHTGVGISHSFHSNSVSNACERFLFAAYLKVHTCCKVNGGLIGYIRLVRCSRLYCLEVIQQQPGSNVPVAAVCHIVEEVYVVTVGGQGNGCGPPGLYHSPKHLIGVFAGGVGLCIRSQFDLYIFGCATGIIVVVAVGIEGDDGACLQGLAEAYAEAGPAIIFVAHLQGVVAAVFRGGNACIGISYSFDGGILCHACTGKEVFVAGCFKVDALCKVAHRLRCFHRLYCHKVIYIDL